MPILSDGSLSLVTATQFATYLQSDLDTASANQALRIASGIVTSRSGQQFLPGTSTVALAAPAGQWRSLPQRPVNPGSPITVLLNGLPVTDWTLVGDRLFRYAGWLADFYNAPIVTVTYSHGGAVPTVAEGAVLAVAADIYENPSSLSSETIDDYTWRRSDSERGAEASLALTEVVRAYRRRPLTVQIG